MATFRRKPGGYVDAVCWMQDGDHPNVKPHFGPPDRVCGGCGKMLREHGWLGGSDDKQLELVCPGMWIVTEHTVLSGTDFEERYEGLHDWNDE